MKNDLLGTREYRESLGSYIETYFEPLDSVVMRY